MPIEQSVCPLMCYVNDAAVDGEPACERRQRITSALLWQLMGRSSLYLHGEVRFALREQSRCHRNEDKPDTLFRQDEVDHLQH